MKHVNLDSLVEAIANLTVENRDKYLEFSGVNFDSDEIQDLSNLLSILNDSRHKNTNVNNFFVGYTIPQISKEFDLLRVGKNSIVNIELKRNSTPEKIQKQLIKNRYYLQFLSLPVYTFTYVSDTNVIYILDNENNLEISSPIDLINILHSQELYEIKDIDTLFKPSNYLVSPFNSTAKFISNEYFLTEQQNNIKNSINRTFCSPTYEFVSITGKPGTGKTLITYNIAKNMQKTGLDVIVIHCGKLNLGHGILNQRYGWRIYSIKEFSEQSNLSFDAIIVDEAQRIASLQLRQIEADVKRNNAKCLFSYDPDQCLTKYESNRNIEYYIKTLTISKDHKLTEKIRSNKEIASFIKSLFDLNKTNPNQDYKNINIQYFNSEYSAQKHAEELSFDGWEVINFTGSLFNRVSYINFQPFGNQNSHEVIGQEFDKVAVFIDNHFFYNHNKKLEASDVLGGRYAIDKMLYQNLTRTREELQIIIVKNQAMLSATLNILNPQAPVPIAF